MEPHGRAGAQPQLAQGTAPGTPCQGTCILPSCSGRNGLCMVRGSCRASYCSAVRGPGPWAQGRAPGGSERNGLASLDEGCWEQALGTPSSDTQ